MFCILLKRVKLFTQKDNIQQKIQKLNSLGDFKSESAWKVGRLILRRKTIYLDLKRKFSFFRINFQYKRKILIKNVF